MDGPTASLRQPCSSDKLQILLIQRRPRTSSINVQHDYRWDALERMKCTISQPVKQQQAVTASRLRGENSMQNVHDCIGQARPYICYSSAVAVCIMTHARMPAEATSHSHADLIFDLRPHPNLLLQPVSPLSPRRSVHTRASMSMFKTAASVHVFVWARGQSSRCRMRSVLDC